MNLTVASVITSYSIHYTKLYEIFLMTALALIMRVAADLGTVEMAASHVITLV